MSAHTPGPWVMQERDIGGFAIYPHHAVNGNCLAIAPLNRRPTSEAKANARLVTAAPDLLAALKEVLFDAFENLHPDTAAQVRAAIAKAEGTP